MNISEVGLWLRLGLVMRPILGSSSLLVLSVFLSGVSFFPAASGPLLRTGRKKGQN